MPLMSVASLAFVAVIIAITLTFGATIVVLS